jgi:hypothetical protein
LVDDIENPSILFWHGCDFSGLKRTRKHENFHVLCLDIIFIGSYVRLIRQRKEERK